MQRCLKLSSGKGILCKLLFLSDRDLGCVATGKQILPCFKLEDIKSGGNMAIFVVLHSVEEEGTFFPSWKHIPLLTRGWKILE